MKALIEKLRSGLDLNSGDIDYAVTLLLSDHVNDELKSEFLTACVTKGKARMRSLVLFGRSWSGLSIH
jgi:hypothetical protein